MTHQEWHAEGVRRFGPDMKTWRFVCPSCGHVATVQDWLDAGASEGEVAFSCVGRHLPNPTEMFVKPGPCNYAGGGLFAINPLQVGEGRYFDFAPADEVAHG
jgi:hypothetical protein